MSISTISTAISVFSLKALSTGEDLKDYLDTEVFSKMLFSADFDEIERFLDTSDKN